MTPWQEEIMRVLTENPDRKIVLIVPRKGGYSTWRAWADLWEALYGR